MKRKQEIDSNQFYHEIKKPKMQTNHSDIISSLKERLAEEQNMIPALKEFIKHIQNEDGTDFVTCYLKLSPEGKELFTLFGINGRPPPDRLQLIWEVFEGILSVTSSHKDDRLLNSSGAFISSKLIENHSKAIYASFGMNSKDAQIKAILKCLAFMVAQNKQSLKDVLGNFDFGHRGFKAASRKRDRKQQPDVRTCFVRFCLAFFVFGDMSIIIRLLEQKGFGALILNDLHRDSPETVQVVLETLQNKVVNNEGILKKTKLLFFSAPVLSKLALLSKNPDEDVRNSTIHLLTVLSTDTKRGILFYPRNEVHTGKLMNIILMKFLQYIRQQIIAQPTLMQLAVNIMKHAPDIIVPYINVLNMSMEPRSSEAYYSDMQFLIQIWKNIPLVSEIRLDINVNKNLDLLLKLVIPSAISKIQFAAALKNKTQKIQMLSFELLEAILRRCIDLKELLVAPIPGQVDAVLDEKKQSFLDSLAHALPNVKNIITVRQNLVLKKDEKVVDGDKSDGDEDEEMEINIEGSTPMDGAIENTVEGRKLFNLCMKVLWFYQTLKPGVLTESGFNVCKLFLSTSKMNDDETVERVLEILILEQTDTRMWLEKKISGGKNIIQMVLETIIEHKNNQDIVHKGKRVFFKILDLIEECRVFSHEFELWVDQMTSLSVVFEHDDVRMTIKKFSESCLKFLNEPYVLEQQLAALCGNEDIERTLTRDEHISERGFSPLVLTVIRRFKKTDCSELDKAFLTSSLQRMLAYQKNTQHLLQVLWKETDDSRETFQHVFGFAKKFLEVLSVESNIDLKDYEFVPEETIKYNESDVFSMTAILLQMSRDSKKSRVKKTLKQISKLNQEIKANLAKYPNRLVEVKTLRNILVMLRQFKSISECTESLESVLALIYECLQTTLKQKYEPSLLSSEVHTRVCDVLLNIFENISGVQNNAWNRFAGNATSLVFDHLSSSSSTSLLPGNETRATLATRNILKNILRDLDDGQLILLQGLIPHLPTDLVRDVLGSVVGCMSVGSSLSRLSGCLADTFDVLRKRCWSLDQCNVDDILQNVDLKKLFLSSVKTKDENQMELFYSIYSFHPSNGKLDTLNYKQFSKLYENTAPVFLKVSSLLIKSDKHITDVFIKGIVESDLQTPNNKQVIARIAPLLESVLLMFKDEDIPPLFVKKLTTDVWGALLSVDALQDNIISLFHKILRYAESTMITNALPSLIAMVTKTQSSDTVDSACIDRQLLLVKKFLMNIDDSQSHYRINIIGHVMQLLKEESSLDLKTMYLSHLTNFLTEINGKEQLNVDNESINKLMSLWKPFVVYILKEHYRDAPYLDMLSMAIEKFYSSERFTKQSSLAVKDMYYMIVGHSNFLEIFVDEENSFKENKDGLVTLLHTVVQHSSSSCNAAFLPVILMAYNASLSKTDQKLLSMLRIYERDGNMLSQHFPLSWGRKAIGVYKEKQSKKDFLSDPSTEIFSALDVKEMTKTAYEFPIHLKFNENDLAEVFDDELYDPRFMLLLFASCFQPGQHVNCKLFFESGCLMLTIASLTSHDSDIRKIAYFIITQCHDSLDASSFREKTQVVYLLMLLKNSICEENARLQSVWGAYLCRYVSVLLRADHEMYPVLNHQLLRKPTLSLKDLPVFLLFLHSSSIKHANERFWVLKLLLNGLKDQSGYYLYKRNRVFELVMACHDSSFVDKKCKPIIVDLIMEACKIFHAAFDLVKVHSLMSWIGSCLNRSKGEEKSSFILLVYTLFTTFKNKQRENSSNKQEENDQVKKAEYPRGFPNECLLLCVRCLRESSSLSPNDLLNICSITAWVLCNAPGDLCMWLEVEDCSNLFIVLQKLLEDCEKSDLSNVADLFNKIVLNLVQNNSETILPLLTKLSWNKIHEKAVNNELNETIDLFTTLQKWRYTNLKEAKLFEMLLQFGI